MDLKEKHLPFDLRVITNNCNVESMVWKSFETMIRITVSITTFSISIKDFIKSVSGLKPQYESSEVIWIKNINEYMLDHYGSEHWTSQE